MSFLVPIVLALLTKPFLQSRLCRGQYSFSVTYFGWGLLGIIALSIGIFWLFGPIFFQQDHGRGDRAFSVTFRIWSLVTTFYTAGIGIGLNHIRKKAASPLIKLYIIMLTPCTGLLLLFSILVAPLYWITYGVVTFVAYKISTSENSGTPPNPWYD